MADATADRVGRYVLDGSDEDLRRLMSLSESFAEHARRAFRRVGVGPGWMTSPFLLDLVLRKPKAM